MSSRYCGREGCYESKAGNSNYCINHQVTDMGKASGIAWTGLGAEVVMGLIKLIGAMNGAEVHWGVVPLTVALVALSAVAIAATEW